MKKNKKMTLVASALAVSGVLAGMVIATNGVSAIIAEENTHVHGDNCIIHHYAAISPTASKAGVKEYWICCNDPNHSISFEAPTTGQITDATHTSDFTVTADDPRYIAPYTFPEVFSTPWAYDTAVTVEEGKVKSLTNKIHIKGSVLKEAYELGYTHFKLHSVGSGEDATQVLGSQDEWQNYYKRYANDNDNRFWLKSFNDKSQGLKIASLTTEEADAKGSITLSDFELFKSSVTESWGSGQITGYAAVAAANKYIAYENGELVFDNAGSNVATNVGEIPASIMGDQTIGGETRVFAVKNLAEGINGSNKSIVLNNASGGATGYYFKWTNPNDSADTKESITSDGFVLPYYGGWYGLPGIVNNQTQIGKPLSLALDNPGAIAIRINYDFTIYNKGAGIKNADLIPLANSSDGLTTRTSIQNVIFTKDGENRIDIKLPNSAKHKGIKLKMIWNASSKPLDNSPILDETGSKKNICFPKYTKVDDSYETNNSITFDTTYKGAYIVLKPETVGTDPTTITFEYSWID